MQKIIERVKQIVLKPRETWETIAAEEDTMASQFKGFLLPLAGVQALAMFIGNWLVGAPRLLTVPTIFSIFRRPWRMSFFESLISAILWYLLLVACIWLVGKVVSYLAPKFGSPQDELKGFKVSVYTFTPFLAAGVLLIIPSLQIITLLAGFYGLYLLYIGLPIMMNTPKDKSLPYFITMAVIIILLYGIIATIQDAIFGPLSPI